MTKEKPNSQKPGLSNCRFNATPVSSNVTALPVDMSGVLRINKQAAASGKVALWAPYDSTGDNYRCISEDRARDDYLIQQADARWFRNHPRRKFRIRPTREREYTRSAAVVVRHYGLGLTLRVGLKEEFLHSRFSDKELANIWQHALSLCPNIRALEDLQKSTLHERRRLS